MKKGRCNIGIITFPIAEAGNIPLGNLVTILFYLSYELYFITGNQGKVLFKERGKKFSVFNIQHKGGANLFTRVINYIHTQFRISSRLVKLSKCVDLWVFFIGAEGLILPILTAKLLKIKVVICSAGSGTTSDEALNDTFARSLALLQAFTYHLSDRNILYSKRLIEEQGLKKYKRKISIAHKHFLDFDRF